VAAEPVRWLWEQRFPRDKLSMLSGDPDLGKTWIALDIISRLTTGRAFPHCARPAFKERRDALWVSVEDDDGDTVLPRLLTLDGDPSRVHSYRYVMANHFDPATKTEKMGEQLLALDKHLGLLERWLINHPLVVLVVLDPLAAFLGGINTHKDSDIRRLLAPVKVLAKRRGVGILGINHLNKEGQEVKKAMYRSMGSIGLVGAARASWLVAPDPERPLDRRLFTKVKCNVQSEDVGGLAYYIGKAHGGLKWGERVETTADEAIAPPQQEKSSRSQAREDAREWLRAELKDGPVAADDVIAKAKADLICKRTLDYAKKDLGVLSVRAGKTWQWRLPGKSEGGG
jgi:hypothetical protein